MRALVLVPLLLVAGCIDVPDAPATEAPQETPFVPYHAQGVVWVTPSNQDPSRHDVPFPVNASGRTVEIALRVVDRYAGTDLPTSAAQYVFQLIDATGEVLDEVVRDPPNGPTTLGLSAQDVVQGEALLVGFVRGGSDGSGYGNRFEYVIDVT